jgi:hypothetical protein
MLRLLFASGKKEGSIPMTATLVRTVNITLRVRIVDILLVPFCKSYNRLKQITNAAYHKTSFILKILSKGIQLLIY